MTYALFVIPYALGLAIGWFLGDFIILIRKKWATRIEAENRQRVSEIKFTPRDLATWDELARALRWSNDPPKQARKNDKRKFGE